MRSTVEGAEAAECSEPAKAALHTLSRVLLENLESLADRLTLVVLQREPSYAQLGVAAPDELRENLRGNLERGIQSLGATVPEGADPQDTSIETGRVRARQGVPLEAVLRAYRLGGRVIWEGLLATSRERFAGRFDHALLDAAGYVWKVIDSSSSALVDAYRLEEARLRSQELSRRHAFLNALLEGRGSEPGFAAEAAAALGLPASGPMLCVVAPVETPCDEPLRSPRDTLAAHGIVSSWHVRPTEIVGLVALGERTPGAVLGALEPAVTGRTGASPVFQSLAEAGDAYALAQTAASTLAGPGVAMLDDRLPEALLAGSPQLLPRLQEVAFRDLLRLPANERDTMFETLEATLDSGGSPTHAAQRLYCHRNTVIYRLQRIESATGRRVADPRDRLLLTLGLLARRHG
ncbi:PucR-like helix-turn-helix protein [Prauserella shujinwangii]|uniref:PucR-like helix-turn-helix protein n=1 Tax=Prauserella shujinwangii TaxID=1453103 RepID=A0A2T0LQW0_9PSEU|nr:PucR family transcriptional regulator [Prauserella shujinwangii]PRX45890.1 PucR-like helix-turn-helix protein [Prauserella shujinwangii]